MPKALTRYWHVSGLACCSARERGLYLQTRRSVMHWGQSHVALLHTVYFIKEDDAWLAIARFLK